LIIDACSRKSAFPTGKAGSVAPMLPGDDSLIKIACRLIRMDIRLFGTAGSFCREILDVLCSKEFRLGPQSRGTGRPPADVFNILPEV
jgi:hypothetical protein